MAGVIQPRGRILVLCHRMKGWLRGSNHRSRGIFIYFSCFSVGQSDAKDRGWEASALKPRCLRGALAGKRNEGVATVRVQDKQAESILASLRPQVAP